MKNLKPILVTIFVSLFAVVSVIHVNKTKQNAAAATPLEMIEVMTRAFDESEGSERDLSPKAGYMHVNEALRHRTCIPFIWNNYLKCVDEDNMLCDPSKQTTCDGGFS